MSQTVVLGTITNATSVASTGLVQPLSPAVRFSDGPPQGLQPLPPLPPKARLMYYRAGTLGELRQRWSRALHDRTDTTIEIAPGSHFRLRGRPLVCDQDISLTVFSSGSGATVDGMRKSQIFKVKGCSLTLRGLSLVNGYPAAGLRAACRDQSSGSWSPYSGRDKFLHKHQPGAEYKAECMDVVGGAISVERARAPGALLLDSSSISNSEAFLGGGIGATLSIRAANNVSVINSSIDGCVAEAGGGIFSDDGSLSLRYSLVTGCRAYNGGGLYTEDGVASLISCSLRANFANSTGGGARFEQKSQEGVLWADGTVNLRNVSFEENHAPSYGSALYLKRTVGGYANNVRFLGNTGEYTLQRWEAPGPTWLCQPGHYMLSDAGLAIRGDFTDCEKYPCAPGYFNRTRGSRPTATCDNEVGCPAGHYCPAGTSEPVPCPSGTSNGYSHGASEDSCRLCYYGQFQPEPRSTKCSNCPAGTYSSKLGQAECAPCQPGGFCEEVGAATSTVWQACPAGTFNPHNGSISSASCTRCPLGTSSTEPGATSSSSCKPCEAGTYAKRPDGDCIPCPHPLASSRGSATCGVCMEGYYLKNASAKPSDIFAFPSEHCHPCPPHADCTAFNTTLESLGVPPGFWRASLLTARLSRCDSDTCDGSGGTSRALTARHLQSNGSLEATHRYCAEGHTGPLCERCLEDDHYFSDDERRCVACPTASARFGILSAVVVGAALFFLAIQLTIVCTRARCRTVHRLGAVGADLGFQAKGKITISFFQVCAVLESVYGVRLHDDFTGWIDALQYFSLNIADLTYPPTCIGAMSSRLMVSALWPVLAVAVVSLAIAAHALVMKNIRACGMGASDSGRSITRTVLSRCLYASVLTCYLALPSVSRSIFLARQCGSYSYDDASRQTISFLVADLSLHCNAGPDWTNEARSLDPYFWSFFVLWAVLLPIGFLALLLLARSALREQRVGKLAKASSFLWRDYHGTYIFWDVIDLWRKIFLTAMVIFIDTSNGSNKLLRLFMAIVVSALHLAILALLRPYRRDDDTALAYVASLLLLCVFASGTILHLCDEGRWVESCDDFVGLDSSYAASAFVVALSATMFAVFCFFNFLWIAIALTVPTLRLASSGQPPLLDLPKKQHFHLFLSHVWSTGQDQTHALVRQLQLLLPDIRIWLDVVNLTDISKLEESVGDSAVVVIFLSKGYFASGNCRREVYAAVELGKPIVAVIEPDPAKGGASVADMKEECRQKCTDKGQAWTDDVVNAVFALEPIPYVRLHDFQIETMKLIALRALKHLPFYLKRPRPLRAGLRLRGELPPFRFATPIVVLTCAANDGAREVVEEVVGAARESSSARSSLPVSRLPSRGSVSVSVEEAETVLAAGASAPPGEAVLILYLNENTFREDPPGLVAGMVKRAFALKIPIAMVHEQDPAKGACAFSCFFDQTPKELLVSPYSLYSTIATALYPSCEHRKVSLRHVLRSIGAAPVKVGRAPNLRAARLALESSVTRARRSWWARMSVRRYVTAST